MKMFVHVPRFGKREIFDTTLGTKYYTFEWSISPQNHCVHVYESYTYNNQTGLYIMCVDLHGGIQESAKVDK